MQDDPFFDVQRVASAYDCTGLIPALPRDDEEDETLSELYSIHDEEIDD